MTAYCNSTIEAEVQMVAAESVAAGEVWTRPDFSWWVAAGIWLVAIAVLVALLKLQRDSYAVDEWWRRAEWAFKATNSANDTMFSFGIAVLSALAESSHARPEDKAVFDVVWKTSSTGMQDQDIRVFVSRLQKHERNDDVNDPSECGLEGGSQKGDQTAQTSAEQDRGAGATLSALRREILRARLKVVLDEQLGRQSSRELQCLAKISLPLD